MQPANIDLTIYKGSTFTKTIQWKTGNPAEPVDLSNCEVRMQIRKTVSDTKILDSLTTTNGRIVLVAATEGKLRIDIPASVSSAYTFDRGVYDLEVAFPNSTNVYRIIEGAVEAVPEVTR
jgi:hypothetical protein